MNGSATDEQHPQQGEVYLAFKALREGRFKDAVDLLVDYTNKTDDFWAWLFLATAWAYLSNRLDFASSLKKAIDLQPDSIYARYLRAYYFLLEEDLEKALWEWTHLVNEDEGWLALKLIEQARVKVDLIEQARAGRVGDFTVLPDIWDEIEALQKKYRETDAPEAEQQSKNEKKGLPPKNIEKDAYKEGSKGSARLLKDEPGDLSSDKPRQTPGTAPHVKKQNQPTRQLSKKKIFWSAILLTVLVSAASALYFSSGLFKKEKAPVWQNMQISEWAGLNPPGSSDRAVFEYDDRNVLIEDFEKAKDLLKNNKINRSRYLLQRIIHSNADFKSREKARIFLNFIPLPQHVDFKDPVKVSDILKEPELYANAVIRWEGVVLDLRKVDQGRQLRLSIQENDKTYLVEAFLPENEDAARWQPYEDFDKTKKQIDEKKKKAIIYGVFKGLVGSQRVVYIELQRLWL